MEEREKEAKRTKKEETTVRGVLDSEMVVCAWKNIITKNILSVKHNLYEFLL